MHSRYILAALFAAVLLPSAALAVAFKSGVKFSSTVDVNGTLSKGSGSFVIDHPQDPANKILAHSFVESPDVKNLYDGIAKLDGDGEAVILLPDYYDALNKDSRYQFFPLEEAMPGLYIKTEEKNNQVTIAGGTPGGRVSWQITGIRHDAYILANPMLVEVRKGPDALVKRGECIYEPLCQ